MFIELSLCLMNDASLMFKELSLCGMNDAQCILITGKGTKATGKPVLKCGQLDICMCIHANAMRGVPRL